MKFSEQFFISILITLPIILIVGSDVGRTITGGRNGNVDVQLQPIMTVTGAMENEMMNKIEAQLITALELLQSIQQDSVLPQSPIKFTEKRRNKFEFIRFGRKR